MSLENMYGVPEELSHSDILRNAWLLKMCQDSFKMGHWYFPGLSWFVYKWVLISANTSNKMKVASIL